MSIGILEDHVPPFSALDGRKAVPGCMIKSYLQVNTTDVLGSQDTSNLRERPVRVL